MKDMMACSQESIDAGLSITLQSGLTRHIKHCESNGGQHWHTWIDDKDGFAQEGRTITKAVAQAMAARHNLELPLLDTDAIGVGFWDGNGNRQSIAPLESRQSKQTGKRTGGSTK
jgi:hypothetical protein